MAFELDVKAMNAQSILICCALFLTSCLSLAQANFSFSNVYHTEDGTTVKAYVLDAGGTPLTSPEYAAELWGGANSDSLVPASAFVDRQFRVPTTFNLAPGLFYGGTVVISSVEPSSWAWLQVRAWDTRQGLNYEDVAAKGMGGYGESILFYAQGGDPLDGTGLPGLPGTLLGLQPFTLRPVIPEPEPMLLLIFGGPAIGLCIRRSGKVSELPRR